MARQFPVREAVETGIGFSPEAGRWSSFPHYWYGEVVLLVRIDE